MTWRAGVWCRPDTLNISTRWAIKSGAAFQVALGASIEKVRQLEERLEQLEPARDRTLRRYRKPGIRSRKAVVKKTGK